MNMITRRKSSSQGLIVIVAVVTIASLFMSVGASAPQTAEASRLGSLSTLKAWIADARLLYPYPQSADKMYRVMMCESGGNPSASGGGGAWLGLFQYAPRTWRASWNPYRTNSIWDAKSQVYATARAWSIGMQSHWSCYYHTSGR
jgi:hypothetical protein